MNESSKHNLDDLYAKFGRVAEMAQLMELEAGNLALSYALIAFDIHNLTNDQKLFLKSLNELFGNTDINPTEEQMKKLLEEAKRVEL